MMVANNKKNSIIIVILNTGVTLVLIVIQKGNIK